MKNGIKAILFCLVCFFMLSGVSTLLTAQPAVPTLKEFYKQDKNQMDLVVLGNSRVMFGYSPMAVYKDRGVISYTLSGRYQVPTSTYFILKEVFKYQNPKVVVMEANELFEAKQARAEMNLLVLQQERPSIDKLKWSYELASFNNKDSAEKRAFKTAEQVNTIYSYHSRWKEFIKGETEAPINEYYTKGQYISCSIYDYENTENEDESGEDETTKISGKNEKNLLRIKKLCEENGAALVLVSYPSVKNTKKTNATLQDICQENDIDYLEMQDLAKDVIDLKSDFSDDRHMNSIGAQKVSVCLVDYLIEQYGVEGQKQNEKYDKAIKYYEKYDRVSNLKQLLEYEDYMNYLMSNREDFIVVVNNDEEVMSQMSQPEMEMLQQLGDDSKDYPELNSEMESDVNAKELTVSIYDKESKVFMDQVSYKLKKQHLNGKRKNKGRDVISMFKPWLLKNKGE